MRNGKPHAAAGGKPDLVQINLGKLRFILISWRYRVARALSGLELEINQRFSSAEDRMIFVASKSSVYSSARSY